MVEVIGSSPTVPTTDEKNELWNKYGVRLFLFTRLFRRQIQVLSARQNRISNTTAGITISMPAFSMPFYLLPFDSFAFRLPFVAQWKAQVNGKNYYRKLLEYRESDLIAKSAYFYSCNNFCCFVDFRFATLTRRILIFSRCYFRFCRKAKKRIGGIPQWKSFKKVF